MNSVYPKKIQLLASQHWTPLHITEMAAEFLTPEKNAKILDIGSGVGKFCLGAAYLKPEAYFFGVEQRSELVSHADLARKLLGLKNVRFLNCNLTLLDFRRYDHFYFFNSFYENLIDTDKIDNKVKCTPALYNYYNQQLYKKLEGLKPGTRLVTYHTLEDHIPPDYQLAESHLSGLLKFWIKIL
ncbi:hypothetical protein GCM10011511_17390 [Puia dinghuensis]|uniref:Methyltransferase domain-containing protein n=1 Tax=Puia dinghuensis TaxID=1792502 RepID=A0A8J2UBJ0_9BACT|nr:hypothetical protein GCM10011511_17390 [Puia dinghuensis]